MKKKITLISDTHNKHSILNADLPGGDILIHAGDISSMGYEHEILHFLYWMQHRDKYTNKVFIAGNHDWGFQNNVEKVKEILGLYDGVTYLEDSIVSIDNGEDKPIKIWGSPWQPEFYNWAFNLPRNGEELKSKWDMIPDDTDILVTHGPAWGFLDDVEGKRGIHLGCELLAERIKQIKPKIHVCGHIHTGYGHYFDGHTHYFNAAVLNERYNYGHTPWNINWDPVTNEIEFVRG
jgi:Icc-related predicted phosphoesterase